jgi:signal transduction histidine kinase
MFRNLRTSTKLILLCSAFIVSVAVTTYALVAEKRIAIDFARKELAGSRYLAAVRDVYGGILTGSVPQTTSPDDVLKMLAGAQAGASVQLQTTDFEQALAGALRLLEWSQTEGGKVDFLVVDALAKTRRLALRVGEESNLVLDPELDSYYLQDVIVAKLPALLGQLGEAQTMFRGAAAAAPAAERRMRFLVLDGLVRSTAEGVGENLGGAYRGNSDGSLRPAIAEQFAAMIRSTNSYLGALNATIVAEERTEIDAAALDRFHETAVANAIKAWSVAGNELDRLLQQRIDGLLRRLYGSLALTGALGALSILIAVMTHRHIVRPLERLEELTSTVRETKDYTYRSFYNSRDEIGRLAGAFNDMLAELARAREREIAEGLRKVATQAELARVARLTTMGEMTASIAHEINQPLAAIVANANAGLRWLGNAAPDLGETQAALKRIVTDGHRASEVIGSIRAMFKKDDQAKAPLDVNELIREILALMHGQLESHKVSLRTELTHALPQVAANRVQLQQVILNLAMNAVEAMDMVTDRRRVLRICSDPHNPPGVLVRVEDSGTGIAAENINRIFDAFFSTKTSGMGMGLSICRSIIEAHGGRLTAVSAQPHGSVFEVFLPADDADPRPSDDGRNPTATVRLH